YDFHIAGLKVLYPNGPVSQEWIKDTPGVITWQDNKVGNDGTVEFSYDGGVSWVNILGIGSLSFIDKASPPFTPTIPTVRGLVKMTADDPTPFTNVYDVSDSYFSVAGVKVEAPVSGVEYTIGATNPVTFRAAATHAPGYVANIYYAANGVNFDTNNPVKLNEIFSETYPGLQTYWWVPQMTRDPSEFARIKVQAGAYSAVSDVFTLRGVKFTSPISTTVWGPGTHTVQWKVAGLASDCEGDVYLSTEGYSPSAFTNQINPYLLTINEGGNFSGGFPWVVPAGIEPTANAVLKIVVTQSPSEPEDLGYTAYSQPFTLQGVRFITPGAGDTLHLGGTYGIQWKAASAGVSAYIYYSSDGGTNYSATPVAQAYPSFNGTNTFVWTVENTRMPTENARLKLVMSSGLQAESGVFRMEGIRVTKPTSSDIYATTDLTNMISWIDIGDGGPYTISYITNYPNMAYPIAVEPPGVYEHNWAVPSNAICTNVVIRVAGSQYTNDSAIFKVVGKPTISIVSPAPGAYWGAGLTKDIEWSRGGKMTNDFTVWFSLAPYIVSNVIFGTVNFDESDNMYRLSWDVPDQLTAVRIRVKHNTKDDVEDTSQPFNICGRFLVWTPNGGEELYAREPTPVTWRTIGSVPFVDVYYSVTPPYGASTWIKANTTPVTNNFKTDLTWEQTTWSWPVADVQTVDAKFRVQEAAHTALFDEGEEGPYDSSDDAFEIKYYTVLWDVFHVDNDGQTNRLNSLSVVDSSGWSASGLSCLSQSGSPQLIVRQYPWGIFDTAWYREYFHDEVDFHWECNQDNMTRQISMSKSQIEPEYHVMATFTYDDETNKFMIVSWLERNGALLATPESCRIEIYNSDGDLLESLYNASPINGVFWRDWDVGATEAALIASGHLGPEGFRDSDVFFARVSITFSGATYSSGITFMLRLAATGKATTYKVISQFLFNAISEQLTIRSWLECDGAIFSTPDNCIVQIYDPNGSNLVTMVESNTQYDVFWQSWDVGVTEDALIASGYLSTNGFADDDVFLAVTTIESMGQKYSSGEALMLRQMAAEDQIFAVKSSFSYNQAISNVAIRAWLESEGVLTVVTNSSCRVRIYDDVGMLAGIVETNIDVNDIFLLNWDIAGLGYSAGDSFFATVEITTPIGTYSAGESFVLAEAGDFDSLLMAINASETNLAAQLSSGFTTVTSGIHEVATNLNAIGGEMRVRMTNLQDIATDLVGITTETRDGISILSTNMALLTNNIISIIAPAVTGLVATADILRNDAVSDLAHIMNRETSVAYGSTNTILYKSRPGYGNAVAVSVSDAGGTVYAGTMSEIVAGIYEHELVADWGIQSYVVTCEDPYPASDSMVLEVVGAMSEQVPNMITALDNRINDVMSELGAISNIVSGIGEGADLSPIITGIEELKTSVGNLSGGEEVDLSALERIEAQLGSSGTLGQLQAQLGKVTDTSSSKTFFGQLALIQENLVLAGADAADASKKAQTAKTEANKAATGIDELKMTINDGQMETATMKERLDNIQSALVNAAENMRDIPKAVKLAGLYNKLEEMAGSIEDLAKSSQWEEWIKPPPLPEAGGGADEKVITRLIGNIEEMKGSMAFMIKVMDDIKNEPIIEEAYVGME
ncbi:MAG: hypothetical protein JXN60_04860, partial [Lentisphaerae bacterium]|nr:hypothetical protein [Lentisphaerota bacterium]